MEDTTVHQTANYLTHFRADNIVRDCEEFRKHFNIDKFSLLGQSFGGFCSVTYLSMFPDSLREVLLTGGLPPLVGAKKCAAFDLYKKLFDRVKLQNAKYYKRFPDDVAVVRKIVAGLLARGGEALPRRGLLTARGFQCLGLQFGLAGGFERVHYLLEDAFDPDGELSYDFLCGFEDLVGLHTAPLYLLLHEAIYCNGTDGGGSASIASNWACHRVRETTVCDLFDAGKAMEEDRPVLFTGEMMFPWMLEEFAPFALSPSFKELGHALAKHDSWGPLYDVEQLKKVRVPVAAATYLEDMFVDFDFAQETAALIGADNDESGAPPTHVRQLMTSAYLHSGLREDGPTLFKQLLALAREEVPLR